MARSTEPGKITRPKALSLPVVQDGKLDKTPVDRRRLFDGKSYLSCTLTAAMLVFRGDMLIVSLTT
jgi:hypothetical protein